MNVVRNVGDWMCRTVCRVCFPVLGSSAPSSAKVLGSDIKEAGAGGAGSEVASLRR